MPQIDNLAKSWTGSMGIKTAATMVHAAQTPPRYIVAFMWAECIGAMADVKITLLLIAKTNPGCFSEVL